MPQAKKKPIAKTTNPTKAKSRVKPAEARTQRKKPSSKEGYQTLRLNKADRPFLSTSLTNQTFYWLIIGVIVLALGGWIVHLQVKINEVYDTIDANQLYYDQMEDLEWRIMQNKEAIEQNKQRIEADKQ